MTAATSPSAPTPPLTFPRTNYRGSRGLGLPEGMEDARYTPCAAGANVSQVAARAAHDGRAPSLDV
jgi:hypothetical protein